MTLHLINFASYVMNRFECFSSRLAFFPFHLLGSMVSFSGRLKPAAILALIVFFVQMTILASNFGAPLDIHHLSCVDAQQRGRAAIVWCQEPSLRDRHLASLVVCYILSPSLSLWRTGALWSRLHLFASLVSLVDLSPKATKRYMTEKRKCELTLLNRSMHSALSPSVFFNSFMLS